MKGPRPRWDSLNLSQGPWTDPRDGARRTQSVPALLDAARRDYLSLLPSLRAAMAAPSPSPRRGGSFGPALKELPNLSNIPWGNW